MRPSNAVKDESSSSKPSCVGLLRSSGRAGPNRCVPGQRAGATRRRRAPGHGGRVGGIDGGVDEDIAVKSIHRARPLTPAPVGPPVTRIIFSARTSLDDGFPKPSLYPSGCVDRERSSCSFAALVDSDRREDPSQELAGPRVLNALRTTASCSMGIGEGESALKVLGVAHPIAIRQPQVRKDAVIAGQGPVSPEGRGCRRRSGPPTRGRRRP